jgi:hypothetical protein
LNEVRIATIYHWDVCVSPAEAPVDTHRLCRQPRPDRNGSHDPPSLRFLCGEGFANKDFAVAVERWADARCPRLLVVPRPCPLA